MAFFPLFVELAEKQIIVIGGGRVAARRIETLSEFGCMITIVSPRIDGGLASLYKEGKIAWRQKEYKTAELERLAEAVKRPVFVLAAANPAVNQVVVWDCRRLGIPVNDASDRRYCDFYFPGLVKEGETVVGITAGGTDHKKAAALTAAVRKIISDVES